MLRGNYVVFFMQTMTVETIIELKNLYSIHYDIRVSFEFRLKYLSMIARKKVNALDTKYV